MEHVYRSCQGVPGLLRAPHEACIWERAGWGRRQLEQGCCIPTSARITRSKPGAPWQLVVAHVTGGGCLVKPGTPG